MVVAVAALLAAVVAAAGITQMTQLIILVKTV
jgi:hypothetical protein